MCHNGKKCHKGILNPVHLSATDNRDPPGISGGLAIPRPIGDKAFPVPGIPALLVLSLTGNPAEPEHGREMDPGNRREISGYR
jgi:hypothetical protein